MLQTDAPAKMPTPFANSGTRNVIPIPSQIGITDGAASFTDGFPPLTYTDPAAGGVPPTADDFNGILFAITQQLRWLEAGGAPQFDSTFSSAVGGYPKWSILQSSDGMGLWISTADNNTGNPDTGGANWVPHFFFGGASQALASSNVTLTNAQASRPIITLTGTLTSNIVLTFPSWVKQWLVVNNTTGAFTITAKTSTGSPVTLGTGSNFLYGDGSNIFSSQVITTASFTGAQSLTANGYQIFPGGRIEQWGNASFADVPSGGAGESGTITFPISFPTSCFGVHLSVFCVSSNNPVAVLTALDNHQFTYQLQEWVSGVNPGTLYWRALGY